MPVATLVPRNKTLENRAAAKMRRTRPAVKDKIREYTGFAEDEVLVSLARCPYRNADPHMADFVLFVDTCPSLALEPRSGDLCADLAHIMADLGFGEFIEIWIRFLPGPWCQVKNGEIVDSVPHPRYPVIEG